MSVHPDDEADRLAAQRRDAVLLARVESVNREAAARSGVEPAETVLADDDHVIVNAPHGRPLVIGRRYASRVPDSALLLMLLGKYVERSEIRESNRRRSLRIGIWVAVLVAAFVAFGVTSDRLSGIESFVLFGLVAVVLYVPSAMVDARLSREFMTRVDFQSAYRFGEGAVDAYAASYDYVRGFVPGGLPTSNLGIFSTGLSDARRRRIIAAGERAAQGDDEAA